MISGYIINRRLSVIKGNYHCDENEENNIYFKISINDR